MDVYTKIFAINLILVFALSAIDRNLLNDRIEKSKMFVTFGLWALISLVSIPVWLCYLVVTW